MQIHRGSGGIKREKLLAEGNGGWTSAHERSQDPFGPGAGVLLILWLSRRGRSGRAKSTVPFRGDQHAWPSREPDIIRDT